MMTDRATYRQYLASLDTQELCNLVILDAVNPRGAVEGDPATWGPETDADVWAPTPEVYPDEAPELPIHCDFEPGEEDEAWWTAQPQEGGCHPDALSPEDRRLWDATQSALAFHSGTFPTDADIREFLD